MLACQWLQVAMFYLSKCHLRHPQHRHLLRRLKEILGISTSNKRCIVDMAHRIYEPDPSKALPGSPIVIMHGMMGYKYNWHSISNVLRKTGRKVITVDARNHGDSPHHKDMTYHDMADDTQNLLDVLDIDLATLIGHSMGGKVFMTCALNNPERVDRLIVVDVAPHESPGTGTVAPLFTKMAAFLVELNANKQVTGLVEAKRLAIKALEEVEQNPSVRQFLITNLVENDSKNSTTFGQFRWKCNLEVITKSLHELKGFPDHSGQKYLGPTMFIGGSESDYLREEDLPSLKELFPKAELKFVPQAGHWVHSQNPKYFLQILQDFLKKTDIPR